MYATVPLPSLLYLDAIPIDLQFSPPESIPELEPTLAPADYHLFNNNKVFINQQSNNVQSLGSISCLYD